jgi:uncharacterized protein YbjT (DUF2867 family)
MIATPGDDGGGRILLTGAGGYVGGELLRRLEKNRVPVRCMARAPEKLRGVVHETSQVIRGDVLDRGSLDDVLAGVDTAYYLVHLMEKSDDFEADDRKGAENFAAAARAAGVRRVIYLGGLGDDADPELSPHLKSRHEVGTILAASGVGTIEFRAAVIIGARSSSFELLKALTERLPVMICPKWLDTPTQPIAIDDVVEYLDAARALPSGSSRIYEIGGADILGYGDMIREYARQMKLERVLIPVPVLTPYLSSLWLALVTPTRFGVGKHLVEGLKNPTVVRDPKALSVFDVHPMGIRPAIERAIAAENRT